MTAIGKDDQYDSLREIINTLSRKENVFRLSQIDDTDKAYVSRQLLMRQTLFPSVYKEDKDFLKSYLDLCVSESEAKEKNLIQVLSDIITMENALRANQSNASKPPE